VDAAAHIRRQVVPGGLGLGEHLGALRVVRDSADVWARQEQVRLRLRVHVLGECAQHAERILRRSVASSVGRLEREGLLGVACLRGVDDVCVASIQSVGDLADRGLARELTIEPAACAGDGQGELQQISRGANAPRTSRK
jgi:hypothetical protein